MSRPLLPNPGGNNQGGSFFMIIMMVCTFMLFMNLMNIGREQKAPEQKPDEKRVEKPNEPFIKDDSDSPAPEIEAAKDVNPEYVTLGSLDSDGPYKMLVYLTNRGASLVRVELNETNRYRDVQDLSGYLGQIVMDMDEARWFNEGVIVQVIGRGTPAEKAGLQKGDRIIRMKRTDFKNETETVEIKTFGDLREALLKTKPKEDISLDLVRNEQEMTLPVKLSNAPISVIRPESTPKTFEEYVALGGLRAWDPATDDQLSFLCTINSFDGANELKMPENVLNEKTTGANDMPKDKTIEEEIHGLDLRTGNWELVSSDETEAVFKKVIPEMRVEVRKTYRLSKRFDPKVGNPELANSKDPFAATAQSGYHLTFSIELKNLDSQKHSIAYQLDGPSGLPLEGAWYGRKTGPRWFTAYGLRDVVVDYNDGKFDIVPNDHIARDVAPSWGSGSLKFIGVDTRYFECAVLPNMDSASEVWHSKASPMRIGVKNHIWRPVTDVSWRLVSKEVTLAPAGEPGSSSVHEYTVFVGPKEREVLANYGLSDTLYAGWFWFVALPLLGILHFLHSIVGSYAISIILLTIIVRLLMYPLSRKQAIGTIKMAQIQPELEEIKKKHEGDTEGFVRAQQELWKKHNYHPLSGCLPVFIQLPIFIGLYTALSIDVALYGSPLLSESIRWCTDLSAPDMMFDWSWFWNMIGWTSFNTGHTPGILTMFALGPYFNLLPMLTIILFIGQQRILMPPPTTDEQRMQRKVMNFMMVFMGFIFFRVPSGLCIYFIASSLWGMAERRFIPKPPPKDEANAPIEYTPKKNEPSKSKKSDKKDRTEPEKKPGFFKAFQEILDKAAEKPGLDKSDKPKKKEKNKK